MSTKLAAKNADNTDLQCNQYPIKYGHQGEILSGVRIKRDLRKHKRPERMFYRHRLKQTFLRQRNVF